MRRNIYIYIEKIALFIFLGIICVAFARYVYNEYFRLEAKVRTILEESTTDFKKFYNSVGYTDRQGYIAHGSGVGEFRYTNCYEGVLDSIQKGFKFIELDLLVTADNIIIGGHHWGQVKQLVGYKEINEQPLLYEEIKNEKVKGKYTIISSKKICQLLETYPDFYLVTDKICDYALLLEQIPYPERLIVEIFNFKDYFKALKAGIKYPTFCMQTEKHFKKVLRYKIPMITTMSDHVYNIPGFLERLKTLHEKGVVIFLFTLYQKEEARNPSFMEKYMGKFFSKFYTDVDYHEIIQENIDQITQ